MAMGKHKKSVNHLSASRGAIFIAINPAKFANFTTFKRDVTKFIREVKVVRRNPGVRYIRIPGEASLE